MALLYHKYQVRPSLEDVNGPARSQWFTHFPNDSGISAPDRTIDYLVLPSAAQVLETHVRQHDTLDVSDHLPVLMTFRVD
jgi:endonuclease/exonuclease/phosphatase family metal-dependent hydrolase